MTIDVVGRRLGWSGSKLSRIETRVTGITPGDTLRLLKLYEVEGPRRDSLLALARAGDWRSAPDSYVELEAEAAEVLSFESMLVPGILQVPEYMRAVIRLLRPDVTPAETERMVAARMTRQALLTRGDGPSFRFVIDEAVLRRPTGGRQVLRAQLRRLAEFVRLPGITMQVCPLDVNEHQALGGAFTVLNFHDTLDPGIVALEHHLGMFYLDEPDDVERHIAMFERLRQRVLDTEASAKLVAQLASS